MSPNNVISFNGVLRVKLLNNSFASCHSIHFDFLLPHIAHFDDSIGLPLLVFNTFDLTLSISFLHFN